MAGRAGGATGRPPLTERRRAETRMEIAEEAVRLFVAKGVAAVTAEDIAPPSGGVDADAVALLPLQGGVRAPAAHDGPGDADGASAGLAGRSARSPRRS